MLPAKANMHHAVLFPWNQGNSTWSICHLGIRTHSRLFCFEQGPGSMKRCVAAASCGIRTVPGSQGSPSSL